MLQQSTKTSKVINIPLCLGCLEHHFDLHSDERANNVKIVPPSSRHKGENSVANSWLVRHPVS